jgi:hypothetical protein
LSLGLLLGLSLGLLLGLSLGLLLGLSLGLLLRLGLRRELRLFPSLLLLLVMVNVLRRGSSIDWLLLKLALLWLLLVA